MLLDRFQSGDNWRRSRDKLNRLVDAVNALGEITGDGLVTVGNDALGNKRIGLSMSRLLERIPQLSPVWRAQVIDGRAVGEPTMYAHFHSVTRDDSGWPDDPVTGKPMGYYVEETPPHWGLNFVTGWPTSGMTQSRTRDAAGNYIPSIILAYHAEPSREENFWPVPASTSTHPAAGLIATIPSSVQILDMTSGVWSGYRIIGYGRTDSAGYCDFQVPRSCLAEYTTADGTDWECKFVVGAYDVPNTTVTIQYDALADHRYYPLPVVGDVVPIVPVATRGSGEQIYYHWYDLTPRIRIKEGLWDAVNSLQLLHDRTLDTVGRLHVDTA